MSWFLAWIILFGFFLISKGSLVSSSRLQDCVLDGSSTIQEAVRLEKNCSHYPKLNCEKKMVVTLVVSNEQQQTETIEAILEDTTDSTGNILRLETPFRIRLSKSDSFLIYPINYVQRVNNKPREEIIYSSLFTCDDESASQFPTCGWYTDELGYVVPHSQGYCCSCSLSQIAGVSNEGSRGTLNCNLFGSNSASAHCLRFDTLWYDCFNIGLSQTSYNIWVEVEMHKVNQQGNAEDTTESITISPEQLIQTTADGQLIAKLIGDFSPFEQHPVLTTKFMMVPSQPLTHPRVAEGMANWMMVDKSDVELDGTVCNKIGVSFEGFRNEYGACKNVPSSCLRNQLEDFYQNDKNKQNLGLVGDYLLGNFGQFELVQDEQHNRFLALRIQQVQNSLITLTFPADDIRFITNRSPGIIQEARVNPFEAGSKDGAIVVTVLNTGSITADYTLSVNECSEYILPILAQQVSLSPGIPQSRTYQVYSTNELKQENHCGVYLFDSRGALLDNVRVNFTTTATQHHQGAQQGEQPSVDGERPEDQLPMKEMGCFDFCAYYNIICLLIHECWSSVAIVVGIVLVVLLVFSCFCYCLLSGNLFILLKCCCMSLGVVSSVQKSVVQSQNQRLERNALHRI